LIRIERYSQERKKDWDLFVDNAKNGIFMHKRDYMDYHSNRFTDNSLIFYRDDNILSLLPLSLHGKELISHGGLTYGGFIMSKEMKQNVMNDCFLSLIDYMKDNGFSKLEYKKIPYIFSNIPSDEDLYSLYLYGAEIFKIEPSSVLNLESQIKMSKGRKAQISRGKKYVTVQRSYDFDTFIELENKVLSERHSTKAVHSADELKSLQISFEDEIQLWVAMYEGIMIAASLLFVYDNVVHTQYMAADDTARKIGGLDAIIDFLIKKFSNEKKYFDFGISSENFGHELNYGLIAQKESFGARTMNYQTWILDINKSIEK